MILPFTRRILSVPEIANRYVPTVLGDIVKKNGAFRGYILMHQPAASSLLLLDGGNITAGAFYSPQSGMVLNSCNCRPLMDNMDDSISVEVMECDDISFMMNHTFLTHRPALLQSSETGQFNVRERLPKEGGAVFARLSGPLAELSLWNDGEFVSAYCFDEELRHYIGCDETSWESGNASWRSFWLTVGGGAKICPPEMGYFEEPLLLVVEKYFVVFSHMQEIMDSLYGENTLQDLNGLLERYKQKYPPLYRGLYINPETHKINWERMLENRSRVDVKFRYDRFPLYLDEVLLDFVRLLYEHTRVEGVRQLRDIIVRLKEYSPDRDSETSDRFFKKLEKVLRV